jgi:hypothetical protein
MLIRLVIFSAFFLLSAASQLKAQYQITDNCILAWEQIMDLKLNSAQETIEKELKANPNNYYAYYLEQNREALALLINPSETLFDKYEERYDKRMDFLEDKDKNSPYYLACRSELLLQTCIFSVLYGEKLSGIRKGYQAYKATNQNKEKFPDFLLSKKLDGFFNVALSNLPSFVQWAASVFGVSGDADTGVSLLKSYYQQVKDQPGINLDAAVFVILPYKLNREPYKAYDFILTLDSALLKYKIINYFYINTAYRSGRNELAYKALQAFDLSSIEEKFIPYDYMMGKVLLRKLDQGAITHFKNYLRFTNNENYIKETFYNMALFYLINGNTDQFKYYKQQANDNGKAVNERDREAVYDSELDYIPDINLTKAKLLVEGGYFDLAKEYLDKFENEKSTFLPYQLEYNLLNGRILEYNNDIENCIAAYKTVINKGSDEDYYFASEAALRLGGVYFDRNKKQAKSWFEKSIDLYQSNFYEYIEEIAKRELRSLEEEN